MDQILHKTKCIQWGVRHYRSVQIYSAAYSDYDALTPPRCKARVNKRSMLCHVPLDGIHPLWWHLDPLIWWQTCRVPTVYNKVWDDITTVWIKILWRAFNIWCTDTTWMTATWEQKAQVVSRATRRDPPSIWWHLDSLIWWQTCHIATVYSKLWDETTVWIKLQSSILHMWRANTT